jgi:hypothetical protein
MNRFAFARRMMNRQDFNLILVVMVFFALLMTFVCAAGLLRLAGFPAPE